jgi:hypothetical protein
MGTAIRSDSAHNSRPRLRLRTLPLPEKGNLFTKTGLHRHPLATFGPAPRDHRATRLGLHAGEKSVRLRAVTPVGLECALGHEKHLLLVRKIALKQTVSINDGARTGKRGTSVPSTQYRVPSKTKQQKRGLQGFAQCLGTAPLARQLQLHYLTDFLIGLLN